MEEIGGEAAPSASQEPAVEQPASKLKKKKKGKAAAAEEEDIDALLAELDDPADQKPAAASSEQGAAAAAEPAAEGAAEPAPEAGKGKKKKKKGKGGAKDEEDLDAVLAELGMAPAAKSETQPSTDAQPQASEAKPADEPADAATAEAAAEEDDDAAAAVDGKVRSLYSPSVCFALSCTGSVLGVSTITEFLRQMLLSAREGQKCALGTATGKVSSNSLMV